MLFPAIESALQMPGGAHAHPAVLGALQHRDLGEPASPIRSATDVNDHLHYLSVTGTVKPFAAAGRHVSYMCTTDRVGLLIRTHV